MDPGVLVLDLVAGRGAEGAGRWEGARFLQEDVDIAHGDLVSGTNRRGGVSDRGVGGAPSLACREQPRVLLM